LSSDVSEWKVWLVSWIVSCSATVKSVERMFGFLMRPVPPVRQVGSEETATQVCWLIDWLINWLIDWLIHSFIHSFIHYGDSYSASWRFLLRSAPDPCTAKKNSFQYRVACMRQNELWEQSLGQRQRNAAARIIARFPRTYHASVFMFDNLYWFLFIARLQLKVLTVIYGSYILLVKRPSRFIYATLSSSAISLHPLRSLDRHDLCVPWVRTSMAKTRTFAIISPVFRNNSLLWRTPPS